MRKGGRIGWRDQRGEFVGDMLGYVGLVLQGIIGSASQLGYGDVCLVWKPDEMRQHVRVGRVLAYLGQDYVPGIQRGSNGGDVALAARDTQDCCVPNHPVMARSRDGEFGRNRIGERVGQPVVGCISSFVIESSHSNPYRLQGGGELAVNPPLMRPPKE